MNEPVKLSFDEWVNTFKPDVDADGQVRLYETYGKDLDKAASLFHNKPLHVWTWIEGEDQDLIIDGFHTSDRCGFFITRKPAQGNVNYEIDYS